MTPSGPYSHYLPVPDLVEALGRREANLYSLREYVDRQKGESNK